MQAGLGQLKRYCGCLNGYKRRLEAELAGVIEGVVHFKDRFTSTEVVGAANPIS